ncbi:MAG: 50S ribosomal protein L35, partial [Nostocaceae cyanobacterium CSU_2_110]|nr:50S ribosomal protein L35 [Nostocaceae cyanobacterium CSU_2_110]
MPKLKSRKAAAKRFRATGTGKIVRRKAFKNHILEKKTTAKKRNLSKAVIVNDRDADNCTRYASVFVILNIRKLLQNFEKLNY